MSRILGTDKLSISNISDSSSLAIACYAPRFKWHPRF
jgi:hypothetical protein